MQFTKADIQKFIDGKLSREEAKQFLVWFSSQKGKEAYENMITDAWQSELERRGETKEEVDSKRKVLLQSTIKFDDPVGRKTSQKILQYPHVGLVASLLVLLGLTYLLLKNPSVSSDPNVIASGEALLITKQTAKGNKLRFRLPDGSFVVLNAESRITYPADFMDNRSIALIGEAYFDVAKSLSSPFIVTSKNVATKALGTSFNINAYEGSQEVTISLASGKLVVEALDSKEQIEVLPGEGIIFSAKKKVLEKQNIDMNQVLNWKEGVLQFDKVVLEEVLLTLERWYGVEFKIPEGQKIGRYSCTATFKPNESLSNVMQVLSHSIQFEYSITEKTVFLDFK